MCGITGFFDMKSTTSNVINSTLLKMSDTIKMRGPDDFGIWSNLDNGIGLAHRRLAIQDLSDAGHQPMHSPSGRYTIVFNGEIYNHKKLRIDLEQDQLSTFWRGHSDTETLLAGFDAWGIKKTLEQSVGMFAFAVWDKQNATIILARDRVGEKPLYYGWQNGVFLFGSELKALKAHPAFQGVINRDTLALYMRYGYIPAPYSIYQDIKKLPAGKILTLSVHNKEIKIDTYWSAIGVAIDGVNSPFTGSASEAVSTLESLLIDAVQQQTLSDVPLGAFLSGGVDSSTIIALMQQQAGEHIKTFSIGFHEDNYNEAHYAKSVAQHLGTDHTELYLTAQDCLNIIPQLPSLYDEPFSDNSQIPTYLVSRLARNDVSVSLSGDAGDELFAGYNNYYMVNNFWLKMSKFPLPLRKIASRLITLISPNIYNAIISVLQYSKSITRLDYNIGDKIHKGANILGSNSIGDLYKNTITLWNNSENIVFKAKELETFFEKTMLELSSLNKIERMMLLDLLLYLPDNILCKVDRAAMGISLETRVPFLDHRVVEFAWQLPMKYRFREGQSKWVLRQVLYKYVPKELIERPKKGFSLPIDSWLRTSLRNWAENLLDESRIRQDGYFNPIPIRQKWKEHLSGQRNWQNHLWCVLIFNQWVDHQKNIL
jgi:asparagine synthase (glutamine-hydrolysing)